MRRRTEQNPELAKWTVYDVCPRSARQPQHLPIAALASPGRMGNYQQDAGQRQMLAYSQDAGHPRLQLFGDEGAAMHWRRAAGADWVPGSCRLLNLAAMLPPTCSIQYRPDLQVLVVRWPADAPLAQLQADFEAVLQAATAHDAHHWLLDVRRREDLAPELAHWTTHDFFPRAAAQLGTPPLRIAALASPTRMVVYETSDYQRRTLAYGQESSRPYRLQLFGDEGAAVHWLNS